MLRVIEYIAKSLKSNQIKSEKLTIVPHHHTSLAFDAPVNEVPVGILQFAIFRLGPR